MMQDAGVALRQILLADVDINTFVSGRIYVEDIPDHEIPNMPMVCVVLRASGGIENNDYGPVAAPRYDIFCYGDTRYRAGMVDLMVWGCLHKLNNRKEANTLIHSVSLSGGPRTGKEPDTGWPIAIRSCTVRYNTEYVV